MHSAFVPNLVSEPFFYSKIFNPRWPHTPDEFTLERRVDVDRLRMEIVLSQPEPPPQCNPSPRRLPAVDTGSEQPGTPRRSPAIGTGSDEPGVSRAETQSTEREELVLFKPVWMVFCASTAQARSRSVFCFNQTSGKTTKKINQLRHNKSLLDRSSRAQRRSGSSKG